MKEKVKKEEESLGFQRSVSSSRMMRGGACSNPRDKRVKSEQIPLDIIIAILLKLPTKSIARFRCVSKQWESKIFRSPYFTESFITLSGPKLFVACRRQKDSKLLCFSSPQHQSGCPSITAKFHMSFPIKCPSDICRGLVCCTSKRNFREYTEQLICNPSTRQCLTLPKLKTGMSVLRSCLGYDRIERQLKLLCTTYCDRFPFPYDPRTVEHQVLALGTGSWRIIRCDIPHLAVSVDRRQFGETVYDWICINGVLYYLARDLKFFDGFSLIICFDIRLEIFSYIEKHQAMQGNLDSALVNYKGKLAMLQPLFSHRQSYIGIKLWVLEDADKHQWSMYTYILPSPWMSLVAWDKLRFVGMTNTGQIVWSPYYSSGHEPFFLVYYNPERNTITKVGIQGMEAYKYCMTYVFLDYVEDVKLMASI